MRTCRFCSRWFRNKQAVRRHLGYCRDYLSLGRSPQGWTREPLFKCTSYVEALGADNVVPVTRDEMHATSSTHGGCSVCSNNLWIDAGWRRVPKQP